MFLGENKFPLNKRSCIISNYNLKVCWKGGQEMVLIRISGSHTHQGQPISCPLSYKHETLLHAPGNEIKSQKTAKLVDQICDRT